ncbi:NAD(P)/FAD-dependent oxidoreductase [Candidatus Bathyarchaeota archaeon]|nr:NAD(P)/FAD-dependent oxidoreductase [Candidatus Bathyarchaeota archaeon]MBS7630656.1 NAD(P)/FAD-dependent oxidoreductase [Candidatus Bathyarchaeota archaeon]
MRLLKYDVVIVGAGPSGSSAAKTAAELGVNVILLEEHPRAGIPNHCAEGLSLNGLKDAGLEPTEKIISQKITKARVYAPNKRFLELTSSNWVGYTIKRDVFDQILSEKACSAGADYFTNTKVIDVIKKNGTVAGVVALQGDEKIKIEAKVVIGADGFASVVRRSAGLGRWFLDVVSCAQYRLGNLKLDEPWVNEFYIGSNVAPGAYAWVFPKSSEEANVGLGVRRVHTDSAISYLKRFISSDDRFKEAKILSITGGITPVSGAIEKFVSNGLMLVGDAAGLLIPCTGAGVHTGVVSGNLAGKVAAESIEDGDTSANRLAEYKDKFQETWGKRIQDSRKVVEMLDKFDDEDLNLLAEVITSEDILALANGHDVARVVSRIVRRSPIKIMKLLAAYMRS